jgi:DNA-binding NtrC family response regulator
MPSKSKGRVLVMDDETALADLVAEALRESGYEVRVAYRVGEAKALIAQGEFDVALLDMHLPDGTGEDILIRLSDEGASTEAIMLTGVRDVTSVVQAMKLGASDYLVKPTPLADLELAVGQARERHRLRTENLGLRARLLRHEPKTSIVTEDPGFLQVLAKVAQVGPSDLPILIQGESGAGKELLARAIHDASHRSMEPFVALDCAAVPEAQIEKELFGYERGAFEGALERQSGVFELADRGTLFLKGISEISATVQPRLLRVLETTEFSRLGSARRVRSHVRLVSATSKDLGDPRERGALREDFYRHINGVTLKVPPLRERAGDILPLAVHFLRRHGIRRSLSAGALEVLKAYAWPGNVRELEMVIRRAGVLARSEKIEATDLPFGSSGHVGMP